MDDMTAFVRAFLRCDGCGNFFRTDAVPQDGSVSEARRDARRHGWVKRMVDGRWFDYCEDCS